MTKKILPLFLQKIQREMMITMRESGYSLQNIADVFNASKQVVYRLTNSKVERENSNE